MEKEGSEEGRRKSFFAPLALSVTESPPVNRGFFKGCGRNPVFREQFARPALASCRHRRDIVIYNLYVYVRPSQLRLHAFAASFKPRRV